MQISTQQTVTVTLTENEASVLTQFLDDVNVHRIIVPDVVKKLHNGLNTELLQGTL